MCFILHQICLYLEQGLQSPWHLLVNMFCWMHAALQQKLNKFNQYDPNMLRKHLRSMQHWLMSLLNFLYSISLTKVTYGNRCWMSGWTKFWKQKTKLHKSMMFCFQLWYG